MKRSILAAFAFLTRLPVPGHPFTSEEIRGASAYFPLVGFSLGAGLALFHVLVSPVGPLPAACLTVAASLLITGAFHEDGLADTADALGGGFTKDQVLSILKDSRVGAFGGAALALSLLLRVALLAQLGSSAGAIPLVLVEGLSRAPPVVLLACLPYATPQGSKSRDIARGGYEEARLALGWAGLGLLFMVAAGWLTPAGAIGLALLSGTVAFLLARLFLVRVGGVTGDFLGALQQIVALAMWLAWAAAMPSGA